MPGFFSCTYGELPHTVYGSISKTDCGIVLQIYGGTQEHVGSVVISTPGPASWNPDRLYATSSVHNLPSHKDEVIAREAAEKAALIFNVPVVCVAGLHIDSAAKTDIDALVHNAGAVLSQLLESQPRED